MKKESPHFQITTYQFIFSISEPLPQISVQFPCLKLTNTLLLFAFIIKKAKQQKSTKKQFTQILAANNKIRNNNDCYNKNMINI